MTKVGYTAKLVNIKIGEAKNWHTICVFRELDGSWSLVQAGGNGFMGYFKGNVQTIPQLLNNVFFDVSDYEYLKV